MSIDDSFKKIIVVKDNIMPRRDDYGITTMGIYNFLLDKNSLDLQLTAYAVFYSMQYGENV